MLTRSNLSFTSEVQRDVNSAEINVNTTESLISPVLRYASSLNRFDYSLVYISLTPVCFPMLSSYDCVVGN